MTSVAIRLALPEDGAGIAAVHVRSWQWAYRGLLPDAYLDGLSDTIVRRTATWRDFVERGNQERRTWVVEVDGTIAGFANAGPAREEDIADAGEVYTIYLEESAAGQGLGKKLLAEAVAFLRSRGHAVAILWVLTENARARRFYERVGWQPDGATKVEQRPGFTLHETRYKVAL